jgi:hypothetical protein
VTSHSGEEVQPPAVTITYPLRCVACGHVIGGDRQAFKGIFPIYALRCVVHVHALVCAECLESNGATGADEAHKLAVAVLRNVGEWLRESPSVGARMRASGTTVIGLDIWKSLGPAAAELLPWAAIRGNRNKGPPFRA